MSHQSIVFEAIGLSKCLGERRILDGVDLVVRRGERLALTGTNGAGKTTLLRCLAAAARPTAGEIRWFGESRTPAHVRRRRIGMVAHESRLYEDLTARENLAFAARMQRMPQPVRLADDWLQSTGLDAWSERRPAQLSRGLRQRLAVARALIHDPELVLLDEPFGGLDHEGAGWLGRFLPALSTRGRAIVFATHDDGMIASLATRTVVLCAGRMRDAEGGDERPAASAQSRRPAA